MKKHHAYFIIALQFSILHNQGSGVGTAFLSVMFFSVAFVYWILD